MAEKPDHEARLVALELMLRGLLAGFASRCSDPRADIERMRTEFHSTINFLRLGGAGVERDHAEAMRELVLAKVDENFDAIRDRVLHVAETEAAQAGKRN